MATDAPPDPPNRPAADHCLQSVKNAALPFLPHRLGR